MINLRVLTVFSLLLFPSISAMASMPPQEQCRVIHWQPDQLYHLKSTLHHATHVILPKKMLGQPIVGNRELWNVEGQGTHLFIKPNSDFDDGSETTITLINMDNESYDFVVSRTDNLQEPCVRIMHDGALIQDASLGQYQTPTEAHIDSLNEQIQRLENQVSVNKEQKKQAVEQALAYHREHIFTGYLWDKNSQWMGSNAIDDVWDDGRFTYIRLMQDNKGLFTIAANIDNEEAIIEYSYDDKTRIYQISGIFPKFTLTSGNTSLVITRTSNETKGSY